MLCDAALVANFVASAMMNGVCCIHSMQEEEKNRKENAETLTAAIRVEWERQRQMDKEHRQQIVEDARREAALQIRLAEERRRNVIAAKMRAANMNKQNGSGGASRSVGGPTARHRLDGTRDAPSVSIQTMPGKTQYYHRGATLPLDQESQYQFNSNNNPKSPSNIVISPRRVNSSPAIVGDRRHCQQRQKESSSVQLSDEKENVEYTSCSDMDSLPQEQQQAGEQEQYVMDHSFPLIVQNTPAQRIRLDSEMSSLLDDEEDEDDSIDLSYRQSEY
mmetsp:Transcript_16179/g.22790  ORF Transcript_16179/g.22790 Transcript_16179/m.22790 type:complete len:276 (+) Transcript_16179:112-939(+)